MLITILTAGTRGDTQPYIALALALQKAGQHVRLVAFENFAEFVKGFGLEFYPLRGDISALAGSDEARLARQADNPLKFVLSFNQLKTHLFDLQRDFFDACQGSDAVVYHPGAAIGFFAAQHLNIPSILATPFPMTPTREYPALIFYDSAPRGKTFNLATHKLFERIMWFAGSDPLKHFWKKEFGRAPRDFSPPFGRQTTRRQPTIISCSDHVFPRPQDWPEHVHNTGYWFLDEEHWQPPQALLDFLQRGAPPVYVGFGSLGEAASATQTTKVVIEALRRSGQRGVLATGWNGLSTVEQLPEEIFILESAPHAWLFPHMAAVVHHGGAGTTSAGFRAGVPSVVIPSGNDQFAWGRRVHELGVGAKPIPRKQLNAENLSAAIAYALTLEIRSVAQQLGQKIRSEKGAETAAQVILNCFE